MEVCLKLKQAKRKREKKAKIARRRLRRDTNLAAAYRQENPPKAASQVLTYLHSMGLRPKFQVAVFWWLNRSLGGAVVDFGFWRQCGYPLLVEIGSHAAHAESWADIIRFSEDDAKDNPRRVALDIYNRFNELDGNDPPKPKPFVPKTVLRKKIKPSAAEFPTGDLAALPPVP